MTVFLNAASGRERHKPARVAAAFRAAGAEPVKKVVPRGAVLRELAMEAMRRGERTLVAGGGDGTISSLAAVLVDTDAALGVLPLGTLNHFARDLGIPTDLEEAVRTVVSGRILRVDAGEVNGRIFINNSSLGLYPRLISVREIRQRRGWHKWLAFAWAAVSVWRRFPVLNLRIEADERRILRSTPFLFVGNNEYEVEGLDLGRRRSLDDGCLWLFAARHRAARWAVLRLALLALARRLRHHDEFTALRAREACIETRHKRQRVALDGELVWIETPLRYRIRPQALRVLVPA